MFNLFSNVLEGVVKTVALPVSIVADVVTLGGELTDKRDSYTEENLQGIAKTLSKIVKE